MTFPKPYPRVAPVNRIAERVKLFAALAVALASQLAAPHYVFGDDATTPPAATAAPVAPPAPAPGQNALPTVTSPLPPPIVLPPSPSPLPADVPSGPITADQAALIALHHQPQITEAAGQYTAAAGVTQQARSALEPSVAVQAALSDGSAISGTGSTSAAGFPAPAVADTGVGSNSAIDLSQLLYDSGHDEALVGEAKANQYAAQATLTSSQATTVLNVKQAFYTLVQDNRLVNVNVANYQSEIYQLQVAQAQEKAGIGLPSDVVQAQTNVSEAALAVNVARNAAEVASTNLALAMGLDPRAAISPADSDEPAPPSEDVNALVTVGLAERPEVISARQSVTAAQDAIKAAKTENAPEIAGAVGLGGKGDSDPLTNSSVLVGAVLTWTPYDSGLTAGRVKQAQGNLTTAEATLTAEEQSVTSDIAQSYLNEELAVQRAAQANDEITNAQEQVALAEGRYKAGIGVFLDITTAQQALLTAQTNQVNALSAVDQARAALAQAIGENLGAPTLAPAAVKPLASPTSPQVEPAR